jgi:hypothetical protein
LRIKRLILPGFAVLALAGAPAAAAAGSGTGSGTASGGAGLAPAAVAPSTPTDPTVSGYVAKIIHGVAYAPSLAPIQVKEAIWAGNQIRKDPYVWGGGHGSFKSSGYDCSGSVSYVLHAAGLLKTPYDSSDFFNWGQRGLGHWITVYTNVGHAFVEIAGIRLDTSSEGQTTPLPGTAPGSGPRWRQLLHNTRGFQPRHLNWL